MLLDSEPKKARILTVVFCTITSLACGTNYGYSVWGPSFATHLKLSATDSNLIGTFGNLGMYATGIPAGMMVDAKTPRWGIVLGMFFFAIGYYPIARAALSFPDSRGTATAFPLAAFGLSALFFAGIALLLPAGVYSFLVLLTVGTVILPLLSLPFVRIPSHDPYEHLPQNENQALHRTSSSISRPERHSQSEEPGALNNSHNSKSPTNGNNLESSIPHPITDIPNTENSSLLSDSSEDFEDLENSRHSHSDKNTESPHLDIRGLALLPLPEFWQLFCMLGLLTGIGLMTINNIGNDAQALWKHYDPSTTVEYIEKRQAMHVSILSFFSFSGRLLSGIGSDILVSKLGRSRFWCLFASAVIFCLAQITGTAVQNPHFLVLVSGLTGLAYGILFGVYPSLVAHCFGVHGLSQNWGTMTLAPVISGNIFNLLYGSIYDSHSEVDSENGHMECLVGRTCYAQAYWVALGAAILGVGTCLWTIRHEYVVHSRQNPKLERGRGFSRRSDHERLA
ncbi:hypothetical protein LTR84_010737 [Exophiala bonariae]|uniref:Nodulin-like domain-containing protein n=1 Tax=Exophiala bonariae TaxID=1690606 RepID=A0AAV9MVA1_9EURO|nr:hypothetical protein LTR84_010737 [Exophiala bonariae]